MQKKNEMEQFTMIGFQMFKRNLRNRRNAYGRLHVFKAFLLNLKKSTHINYTQRAWAMEDIDFNLKVNDTWKLCRDDGVIVKCQRFIASSKKMDGGILPKDVPQEVYRYMKEDPDWRCKKKEDCISHPVPHLKRQHDQLAGTSILNETQSTPSPAKTTMTNEIPIHSSRYLIINSYLASAHTHILRS
jgi:hypothetical protein